jgi:hypothetical protein
MIKSIFNPNKLKTKIIITFLFIFIVFNPQGSNSIGLNNKDVYSYIVPMTRDSVELIKISLENEITSYIHCYAPNSKISPILFLNICKDNNFDLVLAMSQAHIESHYGTRGMAVKTNSIFNVGTYDNGIIKYRYKDPNHSIKPYTSLMNRNYLRCKSVEEILKQGEFVDYKGDRYASLIHYEYRVKTIYDNIVNDTNIAGLYKLYISTEYNKSVEFHNL